jgi:hypothetical protein
MRMLSRPGMAPLPISQSREKWAPRPVASRSATLGGCASQLLYPLSTPRPSSKARAPRAVLDFQTGLAATSSSGITPDGELYF